MADERSREPTHDPQDLERLLVLRERAGDVDGMAPGHYQRRPGTHFNPLSRWQTYHGALAQQGRVHHRLPAMPDVRARYIIYLHGGIIEDQGRRPTHPTWGTYEYQQILDRLAAGGLIVISKQRPPMTDMDMFASPRRGSDPGIVARWSAAGTGVGCRLFEG